MKRVNFSFTRTGNVRERGGLSIDIPEGLSEEEAKAFIKDSVNKGKFAEFIVSERFIDDPVWSLDAL